MSKEQEYFEAIGNALRDAEQGHLFGKPCFKIGGKAFVCFYEDAMVFKLTGDTHEKALKLAGSQLFDPSKKKRPMKEWVQVSYRHKAMWQAFAEAAMDYVDPN